ncbi:MAG TPA: phosphatase [Spirochaetia bacterium]|nr:phosphatase [Spirochaetales bacterium]HRY81631.1 phosphatase [Spirochaetia bacterium]
MRIAIDTHTHSVASGHAYSTVDELARGVRDRGLEGFVLTDHGPALPGGAHPYHFGNIRILPRIIEGVRFYRGIEANILDLEGRIDLEPYWIGYLDFVMAGFHEACFTNRGRDENTRALIAALENPLVDAISHPGNPAFPIEIPAVVARAAALGKALEVNDSSFRVRKGSSDTCLTLARACAQADCPVVCGSDAHYWADAGRLDTAVDTLDRAGVPEALVVNARTDRFEAFVARRRAEKGFLQAS